MTVTFHCIYIYIHTHTYNTHTHNTFSLLNVLTGLPTWLSSKEVACNAGDTGDVGFLPGLRRSPGGGHGNPLQYSCLENPMDRGAWWSTVHGVAKSQARLGD